MRVRKEETSPINVGILGRFAPGLPPLLRYNFGKDFPQDLIAGLSVAAVALPVSVAYAELAGFNPVVGLYSSILPMVAYAVFGTSRQLIVNPDASVCAMVAASVAPLAAGNYEVYWSLSVTLAFLTGLFCIIASFLRLGALADFLSKPILIGFLNGIAISIFLGQIGKLCGFTVESRGIVPRLLEILSKLPHTQFPTLIVGLGTFAVLFLSSRYFPRLPAALVALAAAGAAVALLGLESYGVAILGDIPAGLPPLRIPIFPIQHLPDLIGDAAGVGLVLFSSGMLTSRSFADKNRYEIDVDQEFAAFGVANIASAVSHGFAVTGADSRTAMADANGGRTQVTGIVAALTISVVLLFLTGLLRYVPTAALGVVLVFAAFALFDVKTLRDIWKIDKNELVFSVITTLGVVAVGAIDAILVAVVLALARFIRITARPADEVLGEVAGFPGFHSIDRHPGSKTWQGIVIYRFSGPITFFNSAYFKHRAIRAADTGGTELKWFVLDMIPVSQIDVTGIYAMLDLRDILAERGVRLVFAGRKTELTERAMKVGIYNDELESLMFPTLRQALKAYRDEHEITEIP